MSWDNTIEPGRVSFRIRLRTTAGPGRFQSRGSTSQRMISYPNSSFFPLCDRSVRRSKQCGTLAYGVLDCIVSSLQLTPNVFLGHLREVRVRPTVVSDFMTFARGPCHDLGMFGNIFADHKECGFDMMRSE